MMGFKYTEMEGKEEYYNEVYHFVKIAFELYDCLILIVFCSKLTMKKYLGSYC